MPLLRRSSPPTIVAACLVATGVVSSAVGSLSAPALAADGAPSEFEGESVVVEPPFGALRSDLRPFRPLADALLVGEHAFDVRRARGTLTVARAPGLPPSVRVRKPGTITLRLGPEQGRRKLSVHLRLLESPESSADGGADVRWEYAVTTGARFEFDGHAVLLVDANGDGRFRVGEDARTTPGEPLLLPLTDTIVVGPKRLTIADLAEDGSRITGTLEPLVGAPEQLDALMELNRLRAQGGLPPVVLDPELSAACTAHVEYLRRNNWSGYTNPHGETEGRPGYSEAGVRAARASAIVKNSNLAGIRMHFMTYYHRIAFVNPRLERVGISAGSRTISVIDGKSAAPRVEPGEPDGWDDPVLNPPDGAVDVPTRFNPSGERPEPVSRPESRGYPLLMVFPSRVPVIADVAGELVELRKGKVIPVPTLEPRPHGGEPVFGLIPSRPLTGGAVYRVTFTWKRDGDPETATATFRTQ